MLRTRKPECAVCGGIVDPNGFCGWCDAQDTRAANERVADREPATLDEFLTMAVNDVLEGR